MTSRREAARSDQNASDARHERPPRRALPGWAIDLIRDGVPAKDLQESGNRAVWDALGRTALASLNSGHSRVDWEYEVSRPASKLGQQNRLRNDGKERTKKSVDQALNSAWERAQQRARDSPAWTPEEARQEALRRSEGLLAAVAALDAQLPRAQEVLLRYVAQLSSAQGSVSVNLPRAATSSATGLGEKSVRIHLQKLTELNLLEHVERGRSRTKTRPGRANVYRVRDADELAATVANLSRETRQVGPSAQAGRPFQSRAVGPFPSARAHQTGPTRSVSTVGHASGAARSPRTITKATIKNGLSQWLNTCWSEIAADRSGRPDNRSRHISRSGSAEAG